MKKPASFDEADATPSFHILNDDDIREFVVDELRKLDLAHIIVDENDDETKEALATLSSLHDACSNLEFKVNQEIFGKNPKKTFKKLLDFWMHRFIYDIRSNIYSFLNRRNILSNLTEGVLILRIVDVVRKMTYSDYFWALEELKKEDEKLAKEYDQCFSSVVMPTLKKIFPTLISEEEIANAISEFKLPAM